MSTAERILATGAGKTRAVGRERRHAKCPDRSPLSTTRGPQRNHRVMVFVPVRQTPQVDPDVIHRRLQAMLAAVRASKKGSPRPPETTRLNQLIFPQMANWLPESERDQLRFEFEAELKRLNLAA